MKKFILIISLILAATAGILAIGYAADLWDINVSTTDLLSLIVIIPAAVWVMFCGLNLANLGLYLAGVDFVLIRKFTSLGGAVALIVGEAAVIIIGIILLCAKKNKELTEAEAASSPNGGTDV